MRCIYSLARCLLRLWHAIASHRIVGPRGQPQGDLIGAPRRWPVCARRNRCPRRLRHASCRNLVSPRIADPGPDYLGGGGLRSAGGIGGLEPWFFFPRVLFPPAL